MRDLNDKWWPFFVGGNTGIGGLVTYSEEAEESKINMTVELSWIRPVVGTISGSLVNY